MSGSGAVQGLGMKDLTLFIGMAATIVSLTISAIYGGMWLGSLQTEVNTLKASAVTDGRIARLETKFESLQDANKDMRQAVERLIVRIDRSNRPSNP